MGRDFEYSRIFPGARRFSGGTLAVPVSQPASVVARTTPSSARPNVCLLRRQLEMQA